MSERIRVMRIIARMNVGGPAVQVTGLTRYFDDVRFDHRLYTGWCSDDEADYLLTQGPDVPVRRVDGLGRAVRPGDDALALNRLRKEISEFRPHIIHTHTAKAGVVGRMASLASGIPSARVHTYHGHLLHGYFSPAKTRGVVELERLLGKRTDRLVAVGPQVRDDLLAAGIGTGDQYEIIPPGLEFPTPPPKDEARRQLGIASDEVTISLIGRLTGIKRADRFVDVAAIIIAQRPDAKLRFLVAGDGDTAEDLRTAIAKRHLPITLLGWRDDVETVLAATDVLLLTSDNEGTPVSLIQAAIAGVPVVATDVGSVRHIVEDGKAGFLTTTDPEVIAAQTLRLVDDEALRRNMGGHAQQAASGIYGVDRLVSDHERLYDAIVAVRRTSP